MPPVRATQRQQPWVSLMERMAARHGQNQAAATFETLLAGWDSTVTALGYAEFAIPPRGLKQRLMERVRHRPGLGAVLN